MDRINSLKAKVEDFYIRNKDSVSNPWYVLAYEKHLLVVIKVAEELSRKYQANVEYTMAGALLHDIAYAVMDKSDPDLEKTSFDIGKEMLSSVGFSKEDQNIILNDIIKPHSCDEELPVGAEGKVLATADALAHFTSDFYPYFIWNRLLFPDYEHLKSWVSKKIERDFTRKIFFEEERENVREIYNSLKRIFA